MFRPGSTASLKPRRAWRVLLFVLLGLETAALIGWLSYLVSVAQGRGWTAQHFFPDSLMFTDAFLYHPVFDYFHTEAFNHEIPGHARFAYPPVLAPAYKLFYVTPHRMSLLVLFNLFVWAAILGWALRRLWPHTRTALERTVLVGSVALSFPAVFLFQRGNVEVAVWALTATGLLAFSAGSFSLCAVAFGLAAAAKIYPVLLLGLLLSRLLLRYLLLAVATTLVATLSAIWFTGPTFLQAARGFSGGLSGFQHSYAATLRTSELMYDHSLFSVVKTVASSLGRDFNLYSRPYYLVGALVFGSFYLLRIRARESANVCLFLVVCMVLLPPVSYAYTLVHLYVPGILIAAHLLQNPAAVSRAGAATLVCLAALMLPENLYPATPVLLAGQWQSLLLFTLAVLACFPYLQMQRSFSTDQPA